MRSFLIGGSLSFVCYALVQPKKLWIPAIWESTFASIHSYKIYELMCGDRINLSPDEMRLYGLLFGHHHLDPHAFKRLVDIGRWVKYEADEVLTTQSEHVDKVRVLTSGSVEVFKDGALISTTDAPGNFIGEMALMAQFSHLHDDEQDSKIDYALAAATVKTKGQIVCFEWAKDELLEYLDKDQGSSVLVNAFFEDVVRKLRDWKIPEQYSKTVQYIDCGSCG
jgi:CRP-like cAMP-binding protein